MKSAFAIMNEAITIATNFQKTYQAAKDAENGLQKLLMVGDYFISDEERKVLAAAHRILMGIQTKTTEWDAQKYCEKHIELENEPTAA